MATLALEDMAAHYAQPPFGYTVAWQEEVVAYFVRYYGGADGKQGLRPLVDAIEECDTLLRERDVEPVTPDNLLSHSMHACDGCCVGQGRGILLRVNEMDQLDLDDANYTLPPELACDAEEEQPAEGDAAESDAAEVAGGGSSVVAARGGDDGGGESDGGGGGGGGGDALALAVEPDLAVAREKEFEVMLAEERARSAALEVQVEELSQQIQEYERCVCCPCCCSRSCCSFPACLLCLLTAVQASFCKRHWPLVCCDMALF